MRTDATGTYAYLADALGSVLAVANSSSLATSASHTYEPYGAATSSGETATWLQYTGRENDGTGLYYYRNRYYHPALGRFVSEDPIGLAGGTNLYQYVNGDPINFRDPTGLAPNCIEARIGNSSTSYSYQKELTATWSMQIPFPMGTAPEPDMGPPKRGPRGRVGTEPSPGWEVQIWEIGYREWTDYLVKTVMTPMRRTCSEWRTIKDACGGSKPWFYFDERDFDQKDETRMFWSKWKEWYSRLIYDPQ